MKTRVRQLCNGKWVAERRFFFLFWFGIDARTELKFTWRQGDKWYPHCWVDTEQRANDALITYKAKCGH